MPAPAAPAQVRAAPPPARAPVVAPIAHSQRVERGVMMPPYWMAPQFQVRDWDVYGFAQPAQDQRWVRYYDDALLLDRYGRVIKVQSDFDWDGRDAPRYAGSDVPVYVGDGDYHPDGGDYAYVESYDDQAYAAHDYEPGPYEDDEGAYYEGDHGPGVTVTHHGMPHPGYAYPPPPYGYGYGYYGWGGVTVTETTVTTYGCCAEEQVVVKKHHPRKKRHYKRKAAPVRGELG